MALLVYFLGAFGLAYIVGHSRISLPFRELLGGVPSGDLPDSDVYTDQTVELIRADRIKAGKDPHWDVRPIIPVFGPFLIALVECVACFGFWIGLVWGFLKPELVPAELVHFSFSGTQMFASAFVLGCATSGINLILGKLSKIV